MSLNNNGTFTNEMASQSTQKQRVKRWLKDEDRNLVNIILTLEASHELDCQTLFDKIHKNTATLESWNKIKSHMNAEREIEFLQLRYRKLIRNQKLNKHELLYFTENYNSIPLDDFQIIFPGKSKSTLNKLLANVTAQEKADMKVTKLLEQKVNDPSEGIINSPKPLQKLQASNRYYSKFEDLLLKANP